jgi:hypothetical protein
MKFLKNTVAIVALFTIGSVFGKTIAPRGASKAAAQPTTATQKKSMTQRKETKATPTKTYPQLVTFVKNQRNIWDARLNMLANPFVNTMIEEALAADLDAMQLDALLQTARDYHVQFPNNQEEVIIILQNLEQQRKDAVDAFESRKAMQQK